MMSAAVSSLVYNRFGVWNGTVLLSPVSSAVWYSLCDSGVWAWLDAVYEQVAAWVSHSDSCKCIVQESPCLELRQPRSMSYTVAPEGTAPKFQQLKKDLENRFPGLLKVAGEGTPTATGWFEVSINGKLVHSKKNGDGYVDSSKLQRIVSAIEAVLKG